MWSRSSLFSLMLLATLLTMTKSQLSALPADHLVPPPLPTAQRLSHAGYAEPAEGGFMTRVARWFGLGGQPAVRDQQLSASYAYPKPVSTFEAGGKPCSLCNKYPWVPMVGGQQQQLPQAQSVNAWQNQPQAQASQQRQRAVQFRPQSVFLPMGHLALPPLYQAQPFRPVQRPAPQENLAAPSELRPVPAPTAHPRPTSSSNFEIVQSHQVTDFVTSVEYPATFVPSHNIDLGLSTSMPSNHKEAVDRETDPLVISTVRYQLEDLSSGSVHQHLPASRLVTELSHTFAPPADNYPAASSQQQQEQEQDQQLYYAEQYQEPEPEEEQEPETTTEIQTPPPPPATVIELNNHLAAVHPARGRETPKRLLDSPIRHAQVAGGARPFTRDPAELNFRLSQVYTPTPPPPPSAATPTQAPTPTSTYGAIDASGQYAGMSPPSPQQVIIPYTTKQKPRPFEGPWLSKDNDVLETHEQQESKVATATVTAPPRRTTKYLTKILASNLRDLLKRERETKRRPLGVDISRLQHNIDGWTEQEYNSLSHRPSTPTIRGRSKHIPSEYLTTTTTTPAPITSSRLTRGGGFELGGAGGDSSSSTRAADLSTSINNLEPLQLYGERNSLRFQPVDDNHLLLDYLSRVTTSTRKPTTIPSTTTSQPPTTLVPEDVVTPLYVRSTPAPTELWKQAKVAILPQTNEKVYVVTPQPHHQHHEVTASASAPMPVYQTPAPRFGRMRPTPGTAGEFVAATPTTSSQLHNYTPDIFGLMGLSSYVPAQPVEIIDGNSKVITIVTSLPTAAALHRPTAKPTMSPSPR